MPCPGPLPFHLPAPGARIQDRPVSTACFGAHRNFVSLPSDPTFAKSPFIRRLAMSEQLVCRTLAVSGTPLPISFLIRAAKIPHRREFLFTPIYRKESALFP